MRKSRIKKILSLLFTYGAVILPILILSCTKEKRDAVIPTSNFQPAGPATFSTIQSDVILLGCAVSGCHDNRANPAANLSLVNAETSYNQMVNQPSTQLPGMKMVLPGDPDNSYLVHKLRGTHLSIGGTGQNMPQYAAALPQGQIDRIVQWVLDGAIKN